MVRIFFILAVIFGFISTPSYGQNLSFEKASEYNNFIVDEQNKLIVKIIDYNISNIHNNDLEENNQKRLEVVRQIESSMEKINSLSPFKSDNKLKEAAIAVFSLYKETCDIEFNEINLLRKDRESSFASMENYLKAQSKAEEKLRTAGEQFIKAQHDFAGKHKITIKDISRQNYFEDVSQVNHYSRQVTLEYFRVSKADAYFLDALNNQQASVMEEKRKGILLSGELSMKQMKSIQPYHQDSAYKVKAIDLINYHKNLAENEYLELIQILQKKARTQQDISRYNQIVVKVNETSQKLLSEFNRENKEMLKRNIPVY